MWENLLIPGLEGLELSRVLSNISLGDLQAAVAAAEKEVAAMELELATLEKAEEVARQRAKQAVSFAGLDAGDTITKTQLYSRLKKLQAKKIKLGGKINSIRLNKIPSIIDFASGKEKVGEEQLTRKERMAKAFGLYDAETAAWIRNKMDKEGYDYDELIVSMESGDIDEVLYMYDMSEEKFLEEREAAWEELKAKREEKANKALRKNKGG